MNRADLLYEALRDGKPRSRREIFDRVGYMLTNNAASELRARGYEVVHFKDGRVDVYQLGGGLLERRGDEARLGITAPAPLEQPVPTTSPPAAHNVPVSERRSASTAGVLPAGAAVLAGTCGTETGQLSLVAV